MKKRKCMEDSKVREYMFYRTGNVVLIDNALTVATALVGFGHSIDKSIEEQDAVFIQNLVRLPAFRVTNCSKLMDYSKSMADDIVRLILDVKGDLRGAV